MMTIGELLRILRVSAGTSEGVTLDESVLDVDFEELGYDSVALLEVTARIEREYDVNLEDDAIQAGHTPRHVLELVNGR